MLPPALAPSFFEPHAGSAFSMEIGEARPVELELVSVSALPPMPTRRQPFTLLFRSHEQVVRPQRIYTLGHPVLGALEIFLVPVGRDAAGVQYEAVFS